MLEYRLSNRRKFLSTSGLSIITISASSVRAQQAPVSPNLSSRKHGYAITNGPKALRKKDGSWKLWVRIVNFDDLDHDVNAMIQIATDRGFQQVIEQIPVVLKQKKSFISQVHYTPSLASSTLFYRYVIAGDRAASPNVSSVVTSISPWFDESKPE